MSYLREASNLTADEIEQEVRAISARLSLLNKDMPEMSGMDWANDHGWISQEDWQEAQDKAMASMQVQNAEVEKIEALRRAHPQAMDEFLGRHIDRLDAIRDGLQNLATAADGQKREFAMHFNLTLLPDIIKNLKAWRGNAKTEHWPAWMWRVAFSIGEESEKFIEREKPSIGESGHR